MPSPERVRLGSLVGVSAGTASLLGLSQARNAVNPTTAYLLVGGRCRRDCVFCAQACSSRAPSTVLSRVAWPLFPWREARGAVCRAYQAGRLSRACLQVTDSPESWRVVSEIAEESKGCFPLSASLVCENLEEVGGFLGQGLERICISLDGATPEIYHWCKGGIWERAMDLLREAAGRFSGRIATHLMVGLGESEAEVAQLLGVLQGWGVSVGLFAFTPVRGTALEGHSPPDLGAYRRVQIAHFLMRNRLAGIGDFSFSPEGSIMDYGMPGELLAEFLANGEAFRTSGCPGCNRPYYNERPGGMLYNYPRPLSQSEVVQALAEAGI